MAKKYVCCSVCSKALYYADQTFEQDDCYEFEGDCMCESCAVESFKEKYFKKLED